MKKSNVKLFGFLNGIAAAISYGTNPLFAIPLYHSGLGVESVLFYRYFFACLIYFVWLKFVKKLPLKINFKEGIALFFLGIVFAASSVTLFKAFKLISSGLACTILFIYPVIVAVISSFFGEKITKTTIFSIFLTTFGIILLYSGDKSLSLNATGVALVLLSALFYALYIIGVKNINCIKHIKSYKLSFYVMCFGTMLFIYNLDFCTKLDMLPTPASWLCALALSIFPTIISIETITIAIKIIGPTPSAVLGALEPITAIFFGVLIFGESLSLKILFGIFMIIFGVMLIILKNSLENFKFFKVHKTTSSNKKD